MEPQECVCIVCLDSDPPPIQSGCACRSDTGLAHLDCLVEKAVSQQAHRGNKVWWECQTCGQEFTGAMRTGLGEAGWSRVRDEAAESAERLCAALNLALCRCSDGRFADAEWIQREALGVQRRLQGEEHPDTLTTASNLAQSLSKQGKHGDAERIQREVLGAIRRVLGEEHPCTLASAGNLASTLKGQGQYAEAERIQREVLGTSRRVLGEEHPKTLMSAGNLAATLAYQDKFAEAERMLQATLEAHRRVLGDTHPNTLAIAEDLEHVQSEMRTEQKFAEAERMLQATLEAHIPARAVAPYRRRRLGGGYLGDAEIDVGDAAYN
jgi:tetratricopeptide (TPR) repeat protein